MMDKKTKRIILALCALCLVCAVAMLLIRAASTGTVAVISVDGTERERIDLSRVKESYEIEIATEYGRNLILVEPGRISVAEADCPDGLCVAQGAISGGGLPIICLPHRLSIRMLGGDTDA